MHGERGRLHLERLLLLDLGPAAEVFLTEIIHRHRFTRKGELEQLHSALIAHGAAVLHRSLAAAREQHLYAAQHVLALLPEAVRS